MKRASLVVFSQFLAGAQMNTAGTGVTIRQEGLWTVLTFPGGDELALTTREGCRQWVTPVESAQMKDFIRATLERFPNSRG